MLKLLILLVPVAFGPGCVERPIMLRGVGVVKVAKAIEYLESEAQRTWGLSKPTCRYPMGWRDLHFSGLSALCVPTI